MTTQVNKMNFHLNTKAYFKSLGYGEKAENIFNTLVEENGLFFSSNKSMSKYVIVDNLVYRFSDHWGKVASCDWQLPKSNYLQKNNKTFTVAVCSLSDFINKDVDMEEMKVYNKRMFDKIYRA